MKTYFKAVVFVFVLFFSSTAFAIPNAWLSTGYTRYSPTYYSSSYQSPVTNGYMDLRLFVDNVTFTSLDFSIRYDTNTVQMISDGNVLEIKPGLSVSSVTVPLEGSWVETTLSLTGTATIGTALYQSDAICKVRFIPVAEGTMPVGLWADSSPAYPASFKTCSLSLTDNGSPVPFERKEWNNSTELFTFTDKTSATLIYEYDIYFGNPITNGFLRVVYADESVEDFHVTDHGKGIVIGTPYGGYFITPQPGAVSYTLIFPEYFDSGSLSLTGGRYTNHSQPSGYFNIAELADGFNESLPASTEDILFTIGQSGIGADFASRQYSAALAGDASGIVNKNILFEAVDNDAVRITIPEGLEEDYYHLYISKDGLILGHSWFNVLPYFDVTFTVQDPSSNALPGVQVIIPKFGPQGMSPVTKITDGNGQATFQLPGNSDYGAYYTVYATHNGYENTETFVEVFDSNLEVPISMNFAAGVDLYDFVQFSSWWQCPDCQWNNNCNGYDFNYDGTVNLKDFAVFSRRWLKE